MSKQTEQLEMEYKYSKRMIKDIILADVKESSVVMDLVAHGVQLVTMYLGKDYFESKARRVKEFGEKNDIESIVLAIFTTILPLNRTEEFTAVIGSIAGNIKLKDYREAVVTAAELVAVVCDTNLYDINAASVSWTGTLSVRSNYRLSGKAQELIDQRKYLPPMLCEPLKLTTNTSSALLSVESDSVILKRHNHHKKYVSLRSLNKFNQVALTLNTEFLSKYEEPIPNKLITSKQKEAFMVMQEATKDVQKEVIEAGNKFYLTNKYCKRGRTYSQGYHINTQGTEFKKACVELHNKELVLEV